MKRHALLLIVALLGSPAWAQEPTPPTFDLSSESIRKIVHATAVTQSVALQFSQETKAESKPAVKTVVFVPPEKPPLMKDVPSPRAPAPAPAPALRSNGFLAAAVDTLVGTIVDTVLDDLVQEHATVWRPCQTRADVPTATQNHSMCE